MKVARWTAIGVLLSANVVGMIADDETVRLVAGLAGLSAAAFFLGLCAIRLWSGAVTLRPLDALRKAVIIFAVIVSLRLIAAALLPTLTADVVEIAIHSAIFAGGFALYTTAYRKPA